jgi:hypothetical protein
MRYLKGINSRSQPSADILGVINLTVWKGVDGKEWLRAHVVYSQEGVVREIRTTRAVDNKGRMIGFSAAIQPVVVTDGGENCDRLWSIERGYGTFYYARVQMTKNGEAWGASQPPHICGTLDEAAAFVNETLAKRVAKANKAA